MIIKIRIIKFGFGGTICEYEEGFGIWRIKEKKKKEVLIVVSII